jgi:hypothetical protein
MVQPAQGTSGIHKLLTALAQSIPAGIGTYRQSLQGDYDLHQQYLDTLLDREYKQSYMDYQSTLKKQTELENKLKERDLKRWESLQKKRKVTEVSPRSTKGLEINTQGYGAGIGETPLVGSGVTETAPYKKDVIERSYADSLSEKLGVPPGYVSPKLIDELLTAQVKGQYYGGRQPTAIQIADALMSGDPEKVAWAKAAQKAIQGDPNLEYDISLAREKGKTDYAFDLNMRREAGKGYPKQLKGAVKVDALTYEVEYLFGELNKIGKAVSVDNYSIDNIVNSLEAGKYGQAATQRFGTKAQSIRNRIKALNPMLLLSFKNAENLGARGLDSDRELDFYMAILSDPSKDIESQLAVNEMMRILYGTKSLTKIMSLMQRSPFKGKMYQIRSEFEMETGEAATDFTKPTNRPYGRDNKKQPAQTPKSKVSGTGSMSIGETKRVGGATVTRIE